MKAIKGRDHLNFEKYAEGTGFYYLKGGWGVRVLAMAKCEDGVVRTIRLNLTPDTHFSHPGRTSIKGVATRGYVTMQTPTATFNHPKIQTDTVLFTAYRKVTTS